MSYTPLANVLKRNLRDLRKYIIRDYNEIEELQSSIKDSKIFIQKSQNKIEAEVINFLTKIKPNLKIIKDLDIDIQDFWLINIIDSDLNFARANENFGINISLFEKNLIITNLFYNPLKDEVFYYEKVTGAFKNETRIRVSNKKKKEESLISIFNYKDDSSLIYEGIIKKEFSENNFSLIESGSCYSDLSNLSCGKVDCCVIINPPKKLIIEAGLMISSTGGDFKAIELKDTKIFIAGNKFVDKIVTEMVEKSLN